MTFLLNTEFNSGKFKILNLKLANGMSRVEETYVNNNPCDKETELLPKNSGPSGLMERVNWFRSATEILLHIGEGLQNIIASQCVKSCLKRDEVWETGSRV